MKKLLFAVALFAAQFSQAQWEPDVRLTDDPCSSLTSMWSNTHAISTSGDSVNIVWYDDRDGNREIYYKSSVDGGLTWDQDMRLTYGPDAKVCPSIAVSGPVIHVAWPEHFDGTYNSEIFYKRSIDGGNTWYEDIRLTNTPGWSYSSCMAVSGSYLHLVYYDYDDGWWDVYYKRSTDEGVTWEPDAQLTIDPAGSFQPSIAAAGLDLHVVWHDSRDGSCEIYYKKSTDAGITWGPDTRLTIEDSISTNSCIGVSGSDVYVVWMDNRDGNCEIYFKSSTDGGNNWGVDTRLTNNSGESTRPNLAVSGSGLFIVWVDDSDGNQEIYYKRSTDGGLNWEPDIRLTDDPAESNMAFISTSGPQVHVVWYDNRDGNYEIYYKRDPTGGFPVGIGNDTENNDGEQFSIYPNPASPTLNILFSSPSEENITLRFLDVSGKTFRVYNFTAIEGMNQYTIKLDDFRDGVYFIGLTTGSQNYFRKIIINK